ncbi:MAG: M28 family peptidase [Spirochaetaceae bacterium]|nr:M28 family peptidase [Spirochaetaceae bacterium]
MSFLLPEFYDFVAGNADRFSLLTNWLEAHNIRFSVIPIDGSKHIYINFLPQAYDPRFRMKTILVHYDRAPNSPGANDNSAAVFQVLAFLERLKNFRTAHNMRVFFTDGEEMGAMGGVSDQGAYGIAARFKKIGIMNDDVMAIDGCGRGDVLVISTTGRKSPGSEIFKKRFNNLYERTIDLAREVSPQKWVTAPVPYSDNAAFIASGIPAVAVTMLPREEATALMRNVQRDKSFENALLNHSVANTDLLPMTWRFMHTPFDTPESLTPESFDLMEKFLDTLARQKTVAL